MMLIRSSSTPHLGSLLPSFQESPNHHQYKSSSEVTPKPSPVHHNCSTKLSCSNGPSPKVNKSSSILHSPSPSVTEIKGSTTNTFRRVQSEGNLEQLATPSYSNKSARKRCTLEAIPSVSLHYSRTPYDDYGSEEEEGEEEEEESEDAYTWNNENLVSEEIRTKLNAYYNSSSEGFESEGKMYLATGLGLQGGNYMPIDFNRDGGELNSIEEHYKSMLEENPGNPLFMRNYAQFLYQKKGDLEGAEQYYSRAILADGQDGEILCEYAKLIWELHHDKDRAAAYFERAVQASSEDSHVHAAYASFLWDTEDEDDEEEEAIPNSHLGPAFFHHGVMASTAY